MKSEFAVFILTHGRPYNVKTIKTLESSGYTGKYYLIVDNEDAKYLEYTFKYGDKVIQFNKKDLANKVDEGNNFDERRTITHARNFCFIAAKKLGIKYFIQLDDDYTIFRYRYINETFLTLDNSPKGTTCKNLDKYFKILLNFYKKIPAHSIALSQGGDFIGGGECGLIQNYNNICRKVMNSFICSIDRPFRFVGAMNEDVNTYTSLGSRGILFLTIPYIMLDQTETQSQSGGITDMYLLFGTYCKAFTTVMMHPSSVTISLMGSTQKRIHHLINWSKTTPKIIDEKWKRQETRRED